MYIDVCFDIVNIWNAATVRERLEEYSGLKLTPYRCGTGKEGLNVSGSHWKEEGTGVRDQAAVKEVTASE